MQVKEPIKAIEEVEITFAQALVEADRETLLNILSDNGKFMIQGIGSDTPEANKPTFINWILKLRSEEQSLTYYFDQCTFCKIGNPVGIFNDGSFPKKPKDDSQKEKIGLMFVTNNNKIEEIAFCGSFIKTENEWLFEQNCEKDVKKYMEKKSLTREQALQEIKDNLFWYLELEDE
jgi:hypothetical protein